LLINSIIIINQTITHTTSRFISGNTVHTKQNVFKKHEKRRNKRKLKTRKINKRAKMIDTKINDLKNIFGN